MKPNERGSHAFSPWGAEANPASVERRAGGPGHDRAPKKISTLETMRAPCRERRPASVLLVLLSVASAPEPLLLLPGILMPASERYPALIAELGTTARAVTSELAVYDSAVIPADYDLEHELAAID